MERLIVAIDTSNYDTALELTRQTAPYRGMLKFGSEFFTSCGPRGVHSLESGPSFLDLKYHDIPSTVYKSVKAALPMEPYMLTVHASGGSDMIKAARDAAETATRRRPLIIAVTVLTSTSFSDDALELAAEARLAGADGFVCGGWELPEFRKYFGTSSTLVVPGIRTHMLPDDDQVRTITPERAIEEGADWIVVGRPITSSNNPAAAAKAILNAMNSARS